MVPPLFPPSGGLDRNRRANLHLRAAVVGLIRRFFRSRGYLEVETPIRIPAPAPEAHIEAERSGNRYLHTSPELAMKRLLAQGQPRIFQICKCFRQLERGRNHLPEFTLLEWYTAQQDYHHMMAQTEELINFVAQGLGRGETFAYAERSINLARPWRRLTVAEAFACYAEFSVEQALDRDRFEEIMVDEIEPRLGLAPVFLCDYPAQLGALARLKPSDPAVAERFELYIGGMELCNAFTELTDPYEQRRRFELERQVRRRAGRDVYPLPEPFLKSLAGMPPATGNALGVDRLVMLFADAACIDEVVAFTPEEI